MVFATVCHLFKIVITTTKFYKVAEIGCIGLLRTNLDHLATYYVYQICSVALSVSVAWVAKVKLQNSHQAPATVFLF